jgi:hypothetical protein
MRQLMSSCVANQESHALAKRVNFQELREEGVTGRGGQFDRFGRNIPSFGGRCCLEIVVRWFHRFRDLKKHSSNE